MLKKIETKLGPVSGCSRLRCHQWSGVPTHPVYSVSDPIPQRRIPSTWGSLAPIWETRMEFPAPGPGHCDHLETNPVEGRSISLSMSLYLPNKYICFFFFLSFTTSFLSHEWIINLKKTLWRATLVKLYQHDMPRHEMPWQLESRWTLSSFLAESGIVARWLKLP